MAVHHPLWRRTAALAAAVLLGGCQPAVHSGSGPASSAVATVQQPQSLRPPTFQGRALYTGPHRTPSGMKSLGITGYNYTDTYIDSFAVNGTGGGNIEVSYATSGGNGATCCANIPADLPLPTTVEISWRRDGASLQCKQTVLLDGPVAPNPGYLEVHFYQDGTIQVAITELPSPARLKLERFNRIQRKAQGNVDNDNKFSECTHVR